MKVSHILSAIAILLISAQLSRADEGMWLINDYKGSAQHSVVSTDFLGTGSIISEKGLVITNHHVAYSDICSLSSPERNLIKDGFWARSYEEEIPVAGRKMQVLVEMKDISAEVQATKDSIKRAGGRLTSRKLAYLIEKKYSEESGLEASLDAMWAGAKYYISLSRTYPLGLWQRRQRASAVSEGMWTIGSGLNTNAILPYIESTPHLMARPLSILTIIFLLRAAIF